jgi:hypothetical protein
MASRTESELAVVVEPEAPAVVDKQEALRLPSG